MFGAAFGHAIDQQRRTFQAGAPLASFETLLETEQRNYQLITTQFPLFDTNDEIYAYCSISTDVSTLKQTEAKLQQANIELEQFAYITAHDLRAPMRGIDNLAAWITEDLGDGADAAVLEKLDLMQRRIRRLENLLDDLLSFSRVGTVVEEPEPVDLQGLLQEVIESLANCQTALKCVCRKACPPSTRPCLPCAICSAISSAMPTSTMIASVG